MSGVDEGHFTVTPELQAAALLACVAALNIFATQAVWYQAMDTLKEIDERFPIIVGAAMRATVEELEAKS